MCEDPVTAPRVTTALEAAARDRAAIGSGVDSFDLLLRAGSVAAATILREYPAHLAHGVSLFAGAGNNGGDAYIVAAQLARAGVVVRLHAAALPNTPEAQRAAQLAAPSLRFGAPTGHERLVVDGLLGTGHRGALRNGIASSARRMALARDGGAMIVALDVPSGLDATSGEIAPGSVPACVTLAFGTIKRGVLFARAHAGRIVLLDIGLDGRADLADGAWTMAAPNVLASTHLRTAWNAHKGARGRVAIVGGHTGMAGAVVLAARAALGSGAGLVFGVVDSPSVPSLQQQVVQALAHKWPTEGEWPVPVFDAMGIGPGLGRTTRAAQLLAKALAACTGRPVVLDADALWLAAKEARSREGDASGTLRRWTRDLAGAVCTPHPGEFATLLGEPLSDAWAVRVEQMQAFAAASDTVILLKGTPTLVVAPDGTTVVVPHGTALLATGGSGDLLTGIISTLLAQRLSPLDAAVIGALAHAGAAEVATARAGGIRGITLDAVFDALPQAWRSLEQSTTFPPGVLAELPAPPAF